MAKMKYLDESTTKEIIKKYGDVVRSGSEVFEERSNFQVIPVSPALDIALGGGLLEGSWATFMGDPKSGKTTTALQFASTCQSEEYGSRPVIYMDVEGRLKSLTLSGVHGLRPEEIKVVSSGDEPMRAEQYLNIAETYIKQTPNCVMIIDSISALIPEKELIDDVNAQFRPSLPKLLKNWCKKLGGIVPKQRAIVVMIVHLIANTSGFGKTKVPDGGRGIQYQTDNILEIRYIKPWEVGGSQIGQMIHWKIMTSAAGGFPGGEAQSWLRYGHGIDKTQELFIMAVDLDLIGKAGAWYTCNYLVEKADQFSSLLKQNNIDAEDEKAVKSFFQFQGQDRAVTFLNENPDTLKLLEKQIKEMF